MHDRFVKQVYTDLVLKKEPRSYQRLRTMVNDILEQQQHTLGKDLKRKAKIVTWDMKRLVLARRKNVLSNITQPGKGGVKELDQEARLKETIL